MADTATIARPYARAAFEHARAAGALAPWSELLGRASAALADERVAALVGNPHVRNAELVDFLLDLAGAAGKSTNVEMVTQVVKLGGNGPIMANALAAFGVKVTYLGSLGYPTLHPVFEEFATREGTEYGEQEVSLAVKVEQIRRQLERGEISIFFDDVSGSCQLLTHEQAVRLRSIVETDP